MTHLVPDTSRQLLPTPPVSGPTDLLVDAISELVLAAPPSFAVRFERTTAHALSRDVLRTSTSSTHSKDFLLAVVGPEVHLWEGNRRLSESSSNWDHTTTTTHPDPVRARAAAREIWIERERDNWYPTTGLVDITGVEQLDDWQDTLGSFARAQFNRGLIRLNDVKPGHHLVMMSCAPLAVHVHLTGGLQDFLTTHADDAVCRARGHRVLVTCDQAGLGQLQACMPMVCVVGDIRDRRTLLAADLIWDMWPEGYLPRDRLLELAVAARAAVA